MLKADGTKFGKTAGGAIWLDADKTSPYEFYQFWLNQDDRDVIRYLKFFTFLGQDEINQLAAAVEDEPEKRLAQRRLAEEVTRFVHGEEALESAQHISEILFSGDIQRLTLTEVQEAFEKVPNVSINSEPTNIVELLTETAIEPSRRQAREDITNGAITINGERCTDTDAQLNPKKNFSGKFMVIRRGKKNYFLAKVKD